MKKPYVVSCDLKTVWFEEAGKDLSRDGLLEFRARGRAALEQCFGIGGCDWIPEDELREGMEDFTLTRSPLPIVSLDPAYPFPAAVLDVSRCVDPQGRDVSEGTRRGGALNSRQAVRDVASRLPYREIAIVDDVIFTGKLIERIVDDFNAVGVRVVRIYAGVAIQEGVNRLKKRGCTVQAVRFYEQVIDEVCERDFMPGAPRSGRTVFGCDNVGMPYLLPYGHPGRWASFPASQERHLSRAFLESCVKLYSTELCFKGIRCCDLPRGIWGVLSDEMLVVEALGRIV